MGAAGLRSRWLRPFYSTGWSLRNHEIEIKGYILGWISVPDLEIGYIPQMPLISKVTSTYPVREINESFAKSLNQNALKRLANRVHFYNECYSKRNCPETPKAVNTTLS